MGLTPYFSRPQAPYWTPTTRIWSPRRPRQPRARARLPIALLPLASLLQRARKRGKHPRGIRARAALSFSASAQPHRARKRWRPPAHARRRQSAGARGHGQGRDRWRAGTAGARRPYCFTNPHPFYCVLVGFE